MEQGERRHFVILGCGRVGATVARMLDAQGHSVAVVDHNRDSFSRLGEEFGGETILGEGIDEDVLGRAGIERAYAFIAVSNGDNSNAMASQIAKLVFNTPKVIVRIYDPIRADFYRSLGLDTFCPTLIGANLITEKLGR